MLFRIFSNSLFRACITVAGIMLFPASSVLGSESFAITNTQPDSYVWDKLAVDAPVYLDSSKLTFTDIPEPYVGLDYLRTSNWNTRKSRWKRLSTSNPLISFAVNENVSVYVAMDSRASIPSWLQDWSDTGDKVLARARRTRVKYEIYRKDFSVGNITLGGNEGYSSSYMYFVVVKGQTEGSTPVSDPVVPDPVVPDPVVSDPVVPDPVVPDPVVPDPVVSDPVVSDPVVPDPVVPDPVVPDPVPAPAPVPTVSLTSTASTITDNDSTTLNWTASNADSCTASGGWFGSKETSGTESTAPLTQDTTFTLGCTGPGGSASQSITVNVQSPTGVATLSWTPPTTTRDGSALANLAGYKVYYGTSPGSYSSTIVITNPGISTYTIENLLPATYYFVVTAYDSTALESSYSNEASTTIYQ